MPMNDYAALGAPGARSRQLKLMDQMREALQERDHDHDLHPRSEPGRSRCTQPHRPSLALLHGLHTTANQEESAVLHRKEQLEQLE
jgi:hypothetical protein